MFQSLYLALLPLILLPNIVSSNAGNLEKRSLRWIDNYTIKSSDRTKPDIEVDHLKSHERNVRLIHPDQTYISFVLYKRNGIVVEPNGGIFHFIELETAMNKKSGCNPETSHAGAYRSFYGKCPNDERNLVASGYCYAGKNGLVYNSGTFNTRTPYADPSYYLEDIYIDDNMKNRSVHAIEQALLDSCYIEWKKDGFQTGWLCRVGEMSVTNSLDLMSFSDTDEQCCECCDDQCSTSKHSNGLSLGVLPGRPSSTSNGILLGPWLGTLSSTMMFLLVLCVCK